MRILRIRRRIHCIPCRFQLMRILRIFRRIHCIPCRFQLMRILRIFRRIDIDLAAAGLPAKGKNRSVRCGVCDWAAGTILTGRVPLPPCCKGISRPSHMCPESFPARPHVARAVHQLADPAPPRGRIDAQVQGDFRQVGRAATFLKNEALIYKGFGVI